MTSAAFYPLYPHAVSGPVYVGHILSSGQTADAGAINKMLHRVMKDNTVIIISCLQRPK
jgi:hypothetical protein